MLRAQSLIPLAFFRQSSMADRASRYAFRMLSMSPLVERTRPSFEAVRSFSQSSEAELRKAS